MKKIFFAVCLGCTTFLALAQKKGDIKLGIKIVPVANVSSVHDKNGTPSGMNKVADGYTTKAGTRGGVVIAFTFDYLLSEKMALHTGLWFAKKDYYIRNTDGAYNGTANYNSTYLQLPLVFKYTSREIIGKLRIYGAAGPTLDIRTSESVDGPDYAHFWNMAQNNNIDGRSSNSKHKKVGLFNPIDVTVYIAAGATYEIIDNVDLYAGLFLDKGLINQVNPGLKYDEPNQTKVNSDISWKSFLIGVEFGASYRFSR